MKSKSISLWAILIIILVIIFIIVGYKFLLNKTHDIIQDNENVNTSYESENNNNEKIETENITSDLVYDKNGDFLMEIKDIETVEGNGVLAVGKIDRGTIRLNDEIQIIGQNHKIITTTVTGIQSFRKEIDFAEIGDYITIQLKDISEEDIEKGQVLAKPNSIKEVTKFDANIRVLKKEEGGRNTPFFNNYKPIFYIRTTTFEGEITLPDGVDTVVSGDTSTMTVELLKSVALEVGTKFTVREGGRTVGEGVVTKIY